MSVRTRLCRSALCKTRLPGARYSVNPYVGCTHGCLYCYASFMVRPRRRDAPWGMFVEAKVNLPGVLRQERKPPGRVYLGTVCDPYQPVERMFRLSRQVLEILGGAGFQVEILTKSDLVLRDADLLRRYPGFAVEFTITTLDERVRGFFEPAAVPVERRLRAARELTSRGVETRVFVGPVLPYFSDSVDRLVEIFQAVAATGVRRVLVDRFNYLDRKLPLFRARLQREFPRARAVFERVSADPEGYARELRERVRRALERSGVEGTVVF